MMFALRPGDLSGRIIDCAGGPASFNAELSAEGHKVISCDPLYSLTADEIRARIDATYDALVANAQAARHEFACHDIASPEHLGEVRMAVMQRFLMDFPKGRAEGRYYARSLPHLDFHEDELDLALCSHFLFTYTEQRGDVPGRDRGSHLSTAQELRRTVAAPGAGGGHLAGSRLPGRGQGSSLRVPAWGKQDAHGKEAGIDESGLSKQHPTH